MKEETKLNLVYERALTELFNRLNLKANHRELIRGFILISNGNSQFEVSYSELANLLFGNEQTRKEALRERVRNWIDSLLKWQEHNNLQLIRVLEKGSRIPTDDGRYDYQKPRYEFVLLDELIKTLYSDSEALEAELEALLARLAEQYKPVEKPEKYHPHHQMRKDRRLILTKMRRLFSLSVEAGDNPVEYCQRVLDEAVMLLDSLNASWTEEQNRNGFISDFESLLNLEPNEDEAGDVQADESSSDSIRTEIYHLINTGCINNPSLFCR